MATVAGRLLVSAGSGESPVMEPQRAGHRQNGMRNELRITAGGVAAAVVAAGCGSAPAVQPAAPLVISRGVAAREPAADPRPYGAADTAFGLNVLSAWCRADPRGNLLLSPVSLATGLG